MKIVIPPSSFAGFPKGIELKNVGLKSELNWNLLLSELHIIGMNMYMHKEGVFNHLHDLVLLIYI